MKVLFCVIMILCSLKSVCQEDFQTTPYTWHMGVSDLEREFDEYLRAKAALDTVGVVNIVNDTLKSNASMYKVFKALANYYNLQLELKDPLQAYGEVWGLKYILKNPERLFCLLYTGTGFCITKSDNKMIVQRNFSKDCKCNYKPVN